MSVDQKNYHATVHDYTHTKHPHCVAMSVSLSPSKRKTCSWRQYTWFCLNICIRVENKPCVSKSVWELAYVCVTEILLSTIEFVCQWCESGSVHWVWCLVCWPCVVWRQSLVVTPNERVCLLCHLCHLFLLSPLKKNKKNVFPIPHVFSFFLLQQVFFHILSFSLSQCHSFIAFSSLLFFQLFSHLSSPQSWLFSHSFLFSLTHFLLFL